MGFFAPLGLIGLLSIPVLLLMYFLKQRYQPKEVSSLLLWEKANILAKAQEPWQKLRRNILLALQLAALVLLSLAMARPYFMGAGQVQDYVLALDCSLSMQAEDVEGSRFEAAKEKMEELARSTADGSRFTLVFLSEQPTVVLSAQEKGDTLYNAIEHAQVTAGGVDWITAESLLIHEKNSLGGEVVIFSDDIYEFTKLDALWQNENGGGENTALTLLSYTRESDGSFTVLVRAAQYGAAAEKTVALFADGVLLDSQTVSLEENGVADCYFTAPKESRALSAKIMEDDILLADNEIFSGGSVETDRKVLLVSDQNIFLETALSLLDGVEVYRINSTQEIPSGGYALQIYDGCLPEAMPQEGALLLINPPAGNRFVAVGEKQDFSDHVTVVADENFPDLASLHFDVSQANPITDTFGRAFLTCQGQTLGRYGEKNGRKMAVLSFDLHESDLPLQAGFPIFLYQLMQWYFPEMDGNYGQFYAEASIPLSLEADTAKATIYLPDGSSKQVAPPFPPNAFTDTAQTGIYTLQEENADGVVTQKTFAVNAKTENESDLRPTGTESTYTGGATKTVFVGKEWTAGLILLLLAVILVEWRVRCHAN